MAFGQVRIVEFLEPHEKHYDNVRNLVRYSISNKQTDIHFDIESIGGAYSSICSFKIYGVSRETFNLLTVRDIKELEFPCVIYAGYEDTSVGIVFIGNIATMKYNFNQGNPYLECVLNNNSGRMFEKIINRTFDKNVRREQIIRQVIEQAGYIPDVIPFPEDLNTFYPSGYTAYDNLKNILDEIASDNLIKYSFDDKKVFVSPAYEVDYSRLVKIDFESGLKTIPSTDDQLNIQFDTFLRHDIDERTTIEICFDKSGRICRTGEGTPRLFRVIKYKHIASNINEFTTSVTAYEVFRDKIESRTVYEDKELIIL